MSKKITAKVGTYQKDGETKNRYQDIGVILGNANGEYILLDPGVSLAGVLAKQNAMSGENWGNVMCSIFEGDRKQLSYRGAAAGEEESFWTAASYTERNFCTSDELLLNPKLSLM